MCQDSVAVRFFAWCVDESPFKDDAVTQTALAKFKDGYATDALLVPLGEKSVADVKEAISVWGIPAKWADIIQTRIKALSAPVAAGLRATSLKLCDTVAGCNVAERALWQKQCGKWR